MVLFVQHFLRNRLIKKIVTLPLFHMELLLAADLSDHRKPYKHAPDAFLEQSLLTTDPMTLFDAWFKLAKDGCSTYEEANAFALATATPDGKPSVRMLLLKGYGAEGFKFFTNYESRKGLELAGNPYASMMFHWAGLHKQVRVEGHVEKLPPAEAQKYWVTRPRASQASACVSAQSKVVPSRQYLEDMVEKLNHEYGPLESLPKPNHWGGYVLKPVVFEFWQGQSSRLHDRIRFRKPGSDEDIQKSTDSTFIIERLAP